MNFKTVFNDYSFFYFVFVVLAGSLILYFSICMVSYDLKNLNSKVEVYEKILNREYDRTFESYEDYLLYRIEIGK